jgi:hypothetical protein
MSKLLSIEVLDCIRMVNGGAFTELLEWSMGVPSQSCLNGILLLLCSLHHEQCTVTKAIQRPCHQVTLWVHVEM